MRRLRSRLIHFEFVVEQTRIDLAAHGRDEDEEVVHGLDASRNAELALERTAGVLRFVSASDEPLADELRRLYEAVAACIHH